MRSGSTLGARRTDLSGTIVRKLQTVFSDDAAHVRQYAEHLRAGRYVVGVSVGENESAKESAANALRSAGGQFLNYYAENYVEDLGGKG
jgi:hypothetical protein